MRRWVVKPDVVVEKRVRYVDPREAVRTAWDSAPAMTSSQRVAYVAVKTRNSIGTTISTLRGLGLFPH